MNGPANQWDALTLCRLLAELAAIGKPQIMRMDHGGWHASVDFPAPEGVTAEVRSDFKHETPVEALQCVHDRLGGMRSMINLAVPTPGISHREIVQ